MTDRIITTLRTVPTRGERSEGQQSSALVDLLITRNPLVAHGPRTHASGIALQGDAPVRRPRRRARWDVDAPRVHLGHAGRAV